MSQDCESLWGLPLYLPIIPLLRLDLEAPSSVLIPSLSEPRRSDSAGDLFEQRQRLPVIWRWPGFSPRMFMRFKAASLVISCFFFPREESSPSYQDFQGAPSGSALLHIWGCSQRPLESAHSLRSPQLQRTTSRTKQRKAQLSSLPPGRGCGLRFMASQTGFSGSGA